MNGAEVPGCGSAHPGSVGAVPAIGIPSGQDRTAGRRVTVIYRSGC